MGVAYFPGVRRIKECSRQKRALWVQGCEGLRNIADTKEPCGCGELSKSVRVKERSRQKGPCGCCVLSRSATG